MKAPLTPQVDDEERLKVAAAWCIRLSEGELDGRDQALFEAWLSEAPANRTAFEDTAGIWGAVTDVALDPGVISLRRSALAAIERGQRARWTRRGFGMRVAAGVAVASLVAGGVFWSHDRPQTLETGVGERRVVMLKDGSKVSLDGATEVQVKYRSDRRELRLAHGRAKFDVAKDPARPFTVAAADKVVRATGTQFSVELLQAGVRVVLYEGHVLVRERRGPAGLGAPVRLAGKGTEVAADTALTPGHELVAPLAAVAAEVTPTDAPRSLAWEGGQLVFVDEPLASAVERVNRYAPRPLRIGDAQVGAIRVDGVFSAGDPAAFVAGIAALLPVRAVDEGDEVRLVSRAR